MTFARTFVFQLFSSDTGLEASLRAALVDPDHTIKTGDYRDILTGFKERGEGVYRWTYSLFPDSFRGTVVFYTGTLGAGPTNSFATVTWRAETQDVAPLPVNSGEGDKIITVTVNDGVSPLVGAAITVYDENDVLRAQASTNGSGVAILNLASRTYSVAITLFGYTFAGATLVVTTNAAVTYPMTVNGSPGSGVALGDPTEYRPSYVR